MKTSHTIRERFIPIVPSRASVLLVAGSRWLYLCRRARCGGKGEAGELKFGFAGVGTGTHLGVLEFNLEAV